MKLTTTEAHFTNNRVLLHDWFVSTIKLRMWDLYKIFISVTSCPHSFLLAWLFYYNLENILWYKMLSLNIFVMMQLDHFQYTHETMLCFSVDISQINYNELGLAFQIFASDPFCQENFQLNCSPSFAIMDTTKFVKKIRNLWNSWKEYKKQIQMKQSSRSEDVLKQLQWKQRYELWSCIWCYLADMHNSAL